MGHLELEYGTSAGLHDKTQSLYQNIGSLFVLSSEESKAQIDICYIMIPVSLEIQVFFIS